MKFGYIYKTTNLITGKIYIGKKESNKFVPEYFGSGLAIRNSIKKHGVENFEVKILCWSNNRLNLIRKERFWIKKLDSTNFRIGYNRAFGGEGYNGFKFSDETKKKISTSVKKYFSKNTMSFETRLKMSKKRKNKKLSKSHSQKISLGKKNMKFSETHKINLSIAQKIRFKNPKERLSNKIKQKKAWDRKKNNKSEMMLLSEKLSQVQKECWRRRKLNLDEKNIR